MANKNRPLPNHCDEYLTIAKRAKLSFPLGRALYAVNRLQNGWPRHGDYCTMDSELDVMSHAKVSTAKRWIEHWNRGGSIRCIGVKTAAEYNKMRRVRDAEYRKHLRELKIINAKYEAERAVPHEFKLCSWDDTLCDFCHAPKEDPRHV